MQFWRYSLGVFVLGLSLAYVSVAANATPPLQSPAEPVAAQASVGEVVDKLGDNLMLVYQDSRNHWWFGTWGDGLYRYDGKSIVHFTTVHGLSHNRIDQILEDSTGKLYFSTAAGVNRFDGHQFSKLPEMKSLAWKLKPDDLWFTRSNYNGEIYRYDGEILHVLQLPKVKVAEDYIAKHNRTVSPYGVYTIYRDKLGRVWFGTAAAGVCCYDGRSFEWLTSEDVNELHDGPSNGVRSILEDHEGHFWFNTRYRYAISGAIRPPASEPNREGIFQRLPGIGSLDGKPDGDYEYLSIAEDRDHIVWIATYRDGVYQYDGRQLKHYPIMDGSKVVNLFTVYVDREGTIWLGTHSHGVYRFNGTDFERFEPR